MGAKFEMDPPATPPRRFKQVGAMAAVMLKGNFLARRGDRLLLEEAGQQEERNCFALAGVRQALGARLDCSEFVETQAFDSNKVFAACAPTSACGALIPRPPP